MDETLSGLPAGALSGHPSVSRLHFFLSILQQPFEGFCLPCALCLWHKAGRFEVEFFGGSDNAAPRAQEDF